MEENKYASEYSENKFRNKLKKFAKKAGSKVVYPALVLYYTLQKKDLPRWVYAVILGALGYFILPLDGIPDLAPLVGFSDDLGAMLGAMATISAHIDEDVRARAKTKLCDWFGDDEVEIPDDND